jgi:hypothetical protein
MAPQPKMGLLPEWRYWLDPFDSDHSAPVGPVVVVRIVCSHMHNSSCSSERRVAEIESLISFDRQCITGSGVKSQFPKGKKEV